MPRKKSSPTLGSPFRAASATFFTSPPAQNAFPPSPRTSTASTCTFDSQSCSMSAMARTMARSTAFRELGRSKTIPLTWPRTSLRTYGDPPLPPCTSLAIHAHLAFAISRRGRTMRSPAARMSPSNLRRPAHRGWVDAPSTAKWQMDQHVCVCATKTDQSGSVEALRQVGSAERTCAAARWQTWKHGWIDEAEDRRLPMRPSDVGMKG
mmetsp:Transcript_8901/g.54716  ORF Transcript_8901/g.54716 Transcript_8901/m.54716 type:complete len:208 (-) Transcript_8901:368-991(-)